MRPIFGRDLAAAYNEKWGNYGLFAWPFIKRQVKRRIPRASAWLDLCCGSGAFLKVVAENGFSVIGIDLSDEMIGHARTNAPGVEFQVGDVRSIDLDRKFDVITCMGDSLNYLTNGAELALVFINVRRLLAENGLFIFDMMTYEGLKSHWNGAEVIHDPHRTLILEQTFDEKSAIGRYLITGFVQEGVLFRRFQEAHLERGYRPEEIEVMLTEAGLSFTKYDGHALRRTGKYSDRLLYVCNGEK